MGPFKRIGLFVSIVCSVFVLADRQKGDKLGRLTAARSRELLLDFVKCLDAGIDREADASWMSRWFGREARQR